MAGPAESGNESGQGAFFGSVSLLWLPPVMQENSNPKAFREKPESQIFAKRARHMSVARASPLSDVSG
jgi:hypothetical protein